MHKKLSSADIPADQVQVPVLLNNCLTTAHDAKCLMLSHPCPQRNLQDPTSWKQAFVHHPSQTVRKYAACTLGLDRFPSTCRILHTLLARCPGKVVSVVQRSMRRRQCTNADPEGQLENKGRARFCHPSLQANPLPCNALDGTMAANFSLARSRVRKKLFLAQPCTQPKCLNVILVPISANKLRARDCTCKPPNA